MAEQYGRDFLSAEEFKQRYDEVTAEMYRGLGEQWLMWTRSQFSEFEDVKI